MTTWSVIVPTAAVFIVVALLGARMLSVLARVWPRLGQARLEETTSARAAVVMAPVLLASLVCVALLSAASLDACHCAVHEVHHPHLCFRHPAYALPIMGVSAWFLAAWALSVFPRSVALGRALFASHRWMRKVRKVAPRQVDGAPVRLIDCSERSAFTIGALRPMIVFDRTLWRALTKPQRRAVVHHERAHSARRDGLTLLVLRVFAVLFPSAMSGRLIGWWSSAAERRCDLHAASVVEDETLVADALVAVARVRSALDGLKTTRGRSDEELITSIGMCSSTTIERRILTLLNAPQERPRRLRNDTTLVLIAALIVASVTWWSPGNSIHHAVETVASVVAHP